MKYVAYAFSIMFGVWISATEGATEPTWSAATKGLILIATGLGTAYALSIPGETTTRWTENLTHWIRGRVRRALLLRNHNSECQAINWWYWCRCNRTEKHKSEHEHVTRDRMGRVRRQIEWSGTGPGRNVRLFYEPERFEPDAAAKAASTERAAKSAPEPTETGHQRNAQSESR